MSPLSRRDFLKLTSLLPAGKLFSSLPRQLPQFPHKQAGAEPNIIIVVFDALSANNVGFLGYQRQTMPFLERLLAKAVVYHQHYAPGPFTTPGTTSLLSGTMPWTHRAFRYNGRPLDSLRHHNLFSQFPDYQRIAYSHNPLANTVMYEFEDEIDRLTKRQDLFLSQGFISDLFSRDYTIANLAREEGLGRFEVGQLTNSLFLSKLYTGLTQQGNEKLMREYGADFPRGLPGLLENENFFLLEDVIDWMATQSAETSDPYLAYYHLLPPHRPYRTRVDYFNQFDGDDYLDIEKPQHVFSLGFQERAMRLRRRFYDEFLLYVDSEFERFYRGLEANGELDNTWLIFTSDHGEMFERGVVGHVHLSLNDPVIHIPLVIFPPGQQERVDVHTPTSALDIVPTLLEVTGRRTPDWVEGQILPPFRNQPVDPERSIFSLQGKNNPAELALQTYSASIRKGDFKLIYSAGYDELQNNQYQNEYIEFYNIATDPEELTDLREQEPDIFKALKDELLARIAAENEGYPRRQE